MPDGILRREPEQGFWMVVTVWASFWWFFDVHEVRFLDHPQRCCDSIKEVERFCRFCTYSQRCFLLVIPNFLEVRFLHYLQKAFAEESVWTVSVASSRRGFHGEHRGQRLDFIEIWSTRLAIGARGVSSGFLTIIARHYPSIWLPGVQRNVFRMMRRFAQNFTKR